MAMLAIRWMVDMKNRMCRDMKIQTFRYLLCFQDPSFAKYLDSIT